MGLVLVSLVAVLGVCSAFFFWSQKNGNTQSFDQMKKQLDQQKELLSKHKTTFHSTVRDLEDEKSLRKELEVEKDKIENRFDLLETEKNSIEIQAKEKLTRLENLVEHFKFQSDTTISQLKELEQEKNAVRLHYEKLLAEAQQRHKIVSQPKEVDENTKKFIGDLRNKVKDLEHTKSTLLVELTKVKAEVKTLDPDDIKTTKRKNKQYFYLMQGLRGQKEMLEEQNENWQTALKILSKWVITQNPAQAKKLDDSDDFMVAGIDGEEGIKTLGSLVGKALELVRQGSLVEDEFSPRYKSSDQQNPEKHN